MPPKPAPASRRVHRQEDVCIDLIAQDDPPPPPAHVTKTAYNPHRTLYIVVWFNFGALLVLSSAFIIYALLDANTSSSCLSAKRAAPVGAMEVQRRYVYFTLGAGAVTTIQLPASQFSSEHVVDYSVCCIDKEKALICSNDASLAIRLAVSAAGLVSVQSPAVVEPTSCKFSWSQHN